jgi:hypothetical protein
MDTNETYAFITPRHLTIFIEYYLQQFHCVGETLLDTFNVKLKQL